MSKHILIATQNDGTMSSFVAKEAMVGKIFVEFEEKGNGLATSNKVSSNQPNFDHFFEDGSCISVRQVSALFPEMNKEQYDEVYLTPMLSHKHELTYSLIGMLKDDKKDNAYTYSVQKEKGLHITKI